MRMSTTIMATGMGLETRQRRDRHGALQHRPRPRAGARVGRGPLPAAALLQLMWLASPALPVGGFSYSEGLEAAIESGAVQGEAAVAAWLCDQLRLAQARGDLAVAARAIPAWRRGDAARIVELNDWLRLTREGTELRQQTEQMGRSMWAWLHQRLPDDAQVALLAGLRPAPCWPVAWALAAARSGAPVREALLSHAFGWAENMVQAALKSVPLGQSAGQRILQQLAAAIPAAVDAAIALPDGSRQAFTPMLAILSARHETQYSRLFRS
jgi:urease accessory protein